MECEIFLLCFFVYTPFYLKSCQNLGRLQGSFEYLAKSTSPGNLYKTCGIITAKQMYYFMVPETHVPHSQALACTSVTTDGVEESSRLLAESFASVNSTKNEHEKRSESNPQHDLMFMHAVYRCLIQKHKKRLHDFWERFYKQQTEQDKIREAVFLQRKSSYMLDSLRKFFFKAEHEPSSFEIFEVLEKIVLQDYDPKHFSVAEKLLKEIDNFLKVKFETAEIPNFEELERYAGQIFSKKSREATLVETLPMVVFLISASDHCKSFNLVIEETGKKCMQTMAEMEQNRNRMHDAEAKFSKETTYLFRMFEILSSRAIQGLEALEMEID